ncbi:MAG: hypothetical protein LUQ32_09945, partial [Methanomicrobiales archaeon]|nr:hypothetical protein [Methanomicrobiales archaeon]
MEDLLPEAEGFMASGMEHPPPPVEQPYKAPGPHRQGRGDGKGYTLLPGDEAEGGRNLSYEATTH